MKTPGNMAVGQKYNRLTAVKFVEMVVKRGAKWEFVCDCGDRVIRLASYVKLGKIKSCGCLDREVKTKHGMYDTLTYKSWIAMNVRCYSEGHVAYHKYGGRGITVCDVWKDSFEAFYADMGERPSVSHTLDRIDGDLGYYKDNCRWATKAEQSANLKTNVWLDFKGTPRLIKHIAKEIGITISKIHYWLDRGLTADEINTLTASGKYWSPFEVFIYISDGQVVADFEKILGHDKYVVLSEKHDSPTCIIYKLVIKGKRKYK